MVTQLQPPILKLNSAFLSLGSQKSPEKAVIYYWVTANKNCLLAQTEQHGQPIGVVFVY